MLVAQPELFQPGLGGIAIVRRAYREDIDWLRAIAVLAVVAFHFEAPAVFGGFVGVDIFFVISGYLITGIIASEVKDGTFSFAQSSTSSLIGKATEPLSVSNPTMKPAVTNIPAP